MKRLVYASVSLAAVSATLPIAVATSASANEVAGRPALPTTSVEELLKLRATWGTEPSGKK